ncbi:MAG: xanthine dehydrogenase accessory factor [Salibacteraceae bacterium]|jgi:xanthine/CO dehydrogenase XdhC/CoxF family maturation factor
MTHELKEIIGHYQKANSQGVSCVLVSVVALNGSSYRQPGVRMLIDSSGQMTGAVSGGCVEQEILRNTPSVFTRKRPVMITYDGRYRIGCEGLLYILIEPFSPKAYFMDAFNQAIDKRFSIELHSYYSSKVGEQTAAGTQLVIDQIPYAVSETVWNKNQTCFSQVSPPCFRLYIVGVEHDAQHLCAQAALLGWEVVILKSLDQFHSHKEFPAAWQIHAQDPKCLGDLPIDDYSGIVLMSHNFAKDLNYLIHLSALPSPAYIGVLGSHQRMEHLLSDLIDRKENVSEEFVTVIQGPAGIDIKAITPQEIAISILAQIIEKLRRIPALKPSPNNVIAHEC